jgi:hypothetical protein
MRYVNGIRYLAEQSVEQDCPCMAITLNGIKHYASHQHLQGWQFFTLCYRTDLADIHMGEVS